MPTKELLSLGNKKGYLLFEAILSLLVVMVFVFISFGVLSNNFGFDELRKDLASNVIVYKGQNQIFYSKEFR